MSMLTSLMNNFLPSQAQPAQQVSQQVQQGGQQATQQVAQQAAAIAPPGLPPEAPDVGGNILNMAGSWLGGIVDATAGNLIRCATNICATPLELAGLAMNTGMGVMSGQLDAGQAMEKLARGTMREMVECFADPLVYVGGVAGALVGQDELAPQMANQMLDMIAPNTQTPLDFLNPIGSALGDMFAWDEPFEQDGNGGGFMGQQGFADLLATR